MTTIERDIEVSVPIAEADRQWTRFGFRKAVGGRRRPQADVAWSPTDDARRGGTVRLRGSGSGPTRISLTMDCAGDRPTCDSLGEDLGRDLAAFKESAESGR
jgi:hypothetical protein